MNQREHAGADHGKNRHGLGKAADRVAPALLEQQQNRRDQRAGVADADPPDKVDDGKAPGHRLRDGPDADALQEQPGHRHQQHRRAAARHAEECKPAQRRVRREHNARDLFGDRLEGLARRNDPDIPRLPDRRQGSLGFTSLVAIVTSTLRRRVFHRRFFEFGIQIQHFGHIRRPRTRILVGKHLVAALIALAALPPGSSCRSYCRR